MIYYISLHNIYILMHRVSLWLICIITMLYIRHKLFLCLTYNMICEYISYVSAKGELIIK